MRKLKIKKFLTDKELKLKMKSEELSEQFKRWQCIYIIQTQPGILGAQVADMLGISIHTVYSYVEKYNLNGPESLLLVGRGGRRWSYLSLDEEKALLKKLEKKAAKGLLPTAFDIRKTVETKVGKKVSDDYLWDLLNRHNWKKKVPRPFHPKKDVKAQEDFKKNFPKYWQPPN